MIRVIGLNDTIFKNISENYQGLVAYENDTSNIIEFCEYSDITTCGDHIEISVTDGVSGEEKFTFALCDFWRIEIE